MLVFCKYGSSLVFIGQGCPWNTWRAENFFFTHGIWNHSVNYNDVNINTAHKYTAVNKYRIAESSDNEKTQKFLINENPFIMKLFKWFLNSDLNGGCDGTCLNVIRVLQWKQIKSQNNKIKSAFWIKKAFILELDTTSSRTPVDSFSFFLFL